MEKAKTGRKTADQYKLGSYWNFCVISMTAR
jgi:hypothetical protein